MSYDFGGCDIFVAASKILDAPILLGNYVILWSIKKVSRVLYFSIRETFMIEKLDKLSFMLREGLIVDSDFVCQRCVLDSWSCS